MFVLQFSHAPEISNKKWAARNGQQEMSSKKWAARNGQKLNIDIWQLINACYRFGDQLRIIKDTFPNETPLISNTVSLVLPKMTLFIVNREY